MLYHDYVGQKYHIIINSSAHEESPLEKYKVISEFYLYNVQ
jgi:ribosomal protein L21E